MINSNLDAISFLNPYNAILYYCVMNSWTDYGKEYAHVRHIHTPTTRANIIHSHMIHHARNFFQDIEGVNFIIRNKLFMVNIHDTVLLRFKKLDENKISGNIKTQQTIDFLEQDLPSMPQHAKNLIVGYELNSLQTNISAITITCPKNSSEIEWYFDLDIPSQAEIVNMPIQPIEISHTIKRVKVKEIKKDKENYG
ncbi:MAG: hypothetical protein HY807_02860 [Nitrospirae bacterium]|nr:hypothetical protein [Nitrospirota bacterium]